MQVSGEHISSSNHALWWLWCVGAQAGHDDGHLGTDGVLSVGTQKVELQDGGQAGSTMIHNRMRG
jgi:hypothetical protein